MTDETGQLVEHFFRRESANLVAVLTRAFGFALINVIEDMVQESMMQALRSWRIHGVPENPSAWIHRVARNRIIDVLRRDREAANTETVLANAVETRQDLLSFDQPRIDDSLLRMIFACCHPTLERRSRLALTLKVLCGFGDQEVARGLLLKPEAVRKRVTRAKRYLQLNRVSLEFPSESELAARLDSVHDILYLMFNEGYSSTRGDSAVKIDLCEEAARLCHLLCESEFGRPTSFALLALMLFHASRLESRMDESGDVILLEEQDRTRWDSDMIRVANVWLTRSSQGAPSRFHLEAGVARLHCLAPSVDETDWSAIVKHYDLMQQLFPSALVRLNRAVARSRLGQHESALAQLQELEREGELRDYPLLFCALAEVLQHLGKTERAITYWRMALEHIHSTPDRQLIESRIAAWSTSATS